MTIDEVIQIIKDKEPLYLDDARLAFKVTHEREAPRKFTAKELMALVEDRVREDYPEQFDDLNDETGASVLTLDASEKATMLAALRKFQQEYQHSHTAFIKACWPMHFDDAEPLGPEAIDALCERINCS